RSYEVALRVDPPPLGHGHEPVVDAPAIGARLAGVLGASTLQGHAAAVVAQAPDLLHVGPGQPSLARRRRQLGALVLDGSCRWAGLLDQRRNDTLNRRMGQVPVTG